MSGAHEREAAAGLQPGDQVEWGAPVPGRGKTEGEVVVRLQHGQILLFHESRRGIRDFAFTLR